MVRRAVQRAVQLHTQQRLPPKACRQQACAWPHRAYAVGRLRYVRRGPAMPPCPCKCLTVRMSFAASIMSSSPLAAPGPNLPQPMHEELAQAPIWAGWEGGAKGQHGAGGEGDARGDAGVAWSQQGGTRGSRGEVRFATTAGGTGVL